MIREIGTVDGLLATGPEGDPKLDIGGLLLEKVNWSFSLESPFRPSIIFASTPPSDKRFTLFPGDPFLLYVPIVFSLRFNKTFSLISVSAFEMLLLLILFSSSLDVVAWALLPVGELDGSLLCDGVDNRLGAVCGTAADEAESVKRCTPVFNNAPVAGFVGFMSLDEGVATPSVIPRSRVD